MVLFDKHDIQLSFLFFYSLGSVEQTIMSWHKKVLVLLGQLFLYLSNIWPGLKQCICVLKSFNKGKAQPQTEQDLLLLNVAVCIVSIIMPAHPFRNAAFLLLTWSALCPIRPLQSRDAGDSKFSATFLLRASDTVSPAARLKLIHLNVFTQVKRTFTIGMEGRVIGPGPYRATKLVSPLVAFATYG